MRWSCADPRGMIDPAILMTFVPQFMNRVVGAVIDSVPFSAPFEQLR